MGGVAPWVRKLERRAQAQAQPEPGRPPVGGAVDPAAVVRALLHRAKAHQRIGGPKGGSTLNRREFRQPDDPTVPTGRALAAQRAALGVSQRDLAAACGVSRGLVAEIEREKRQSLPGRRRMAEALRRRVAAPPAA
jgi:DNA-binding XRE family transcriptional regulator